MSGKQNILIIGGGSAGAISAKGLSDGLDPAAFDITLVTERAFHIHYPALPRIIATSDGELENVALNPYDKLFTPGRAGKVVVGTVEQVEDGTATLADGQKLSYDWLVLATGSTWEGPLVLPHDRSEAGEFINAWRAKIAKAKNIVLVGGGAVGIEFAGEFHHYHPSTNITLVQSAPELLNDAYPLKFRKTARSALQKLGVKVIVDDRVEIPAEPYSSVTTGKGVKIDADLVIPTRGQRPNTAFLKSFDPSILTDSGRVKVLPSLRVPLANGKQNVYAIGDIIEWEQQKGLAKIPSHAEVVVPNMISAIKKQQPKKVYKGFMDAMVMPFGPNGGIGYLPVLWGITLGDWGTKKIKAQTLFIDLARKTLGYPPMAP